jgi:GNAT superfamily N-acetyltransferase
MAAVTHSPRVQVRAAAVGEGMSIAMLWRELWEAHEEWGGYAGSRDPRVYWQLAQRLDDDARVRAGHPILGRHVHLVADLGGMVCGQVEGWFERHGANPSTPFTCEVRSLVVTRRVRHYGAGRALLDQLARSARTLSRGAPCVLAAEVLERNPAHPFYTRVGYAPVGWNARIEAEGGAAIDLRTAPGIACDAKGIDDSGRQPGQAGQFAARLAVPSDALPIARLETMLAARRRAHGDSRFDRPRSMDASLLDSIAAHLAIVAGSSFREPTMLVAADHAGVARAVATFTVHPLEPPFVPIKRALVGRFALDASCPTKPLVVALVGLACRLALARGASQVELTDLSPPGTQLHEAVLATGARAWSRVVTKCA